jgi:hypothetical protein
MPHVIIKLSTLGCRLVSSYTVRPRRPGREAAQFCLPFQVVPGQLVTLLISDALGVEVNSDVVPGESLGSPTAGT